MKTRSFLDRLFPYPIPRLAAVTLVVLAGSRLAFCGPIHDAAKNGDLARVRTLLRGEPSLAFSKNEAGETPLHLAAENGHRKIAELVLAYNGDVNAKDDMGMTPLHMAAHMGHNDVAELLLAKGADVNAKDNAFSSQLGHSVFSQPLCTMRRLLATGT